MTMNVTMTQTRMGESGSLLVSGQTYEVSDDFGRWLVGRGYATDDDSIIQVESLEVQLFRVSAAKLAELAAGSSLVDGSFYEVADTLYRATSTSAYSEVGAAASHLGAVANEAAMVALSTAVVGSMCTRTDTGTVWILSTGTYETAGNWQDTGASSGGGGFKVPQTESAGRALTSGDSGCWLIYTSAGAATFTIPTGLTIGSAGAVSSWQPVTIQRGYGAGAVTIECADNSLTLNNVVDGTKVLTVEGEYSQIIAQSATVFQAL